MQLTFLNAWRNLDQLSDPAAFNTWIQVIARNLSTSHLRKKNFVLLLDAEKDDTPVDIEDTELLLPEVYAEQEDLSRRLGKIIDSLSDVQRQAVMLFYFDQLSVEEIAQVMECSTGTVKSRLFLARKTIRTEIRCHPLPLAASWSASAPPSHRRRQARHKAPQPPGAAAYRLQPELRRRRRQARRQELQRRLGSLWA